ncbi:amine oxidase, flavin-containing family protein [Metarhizium guizhouense ARSEF 977]|uniref:Amine oxidase, flavin-containing family protein n=1 Tax=Metarhizium guizhouense (strain ARSEF 977) TaxID=1276136 RepID=A0A0B4H1J2_METGA|nr:amine oxidase, flavin-containing family protein [Metarhizium guizhouense ARSEF 977]
MKMTDLKTHPDAPDGSIIPYYMKNGDEHSCTVEPWCFNDITLWGTYSSIVSQESDPFKISTDNTIPKILLENPPDQVMNASIEPLREALRRDAKQKPPGREGWNLLMQYDKFSTRQFLGIGGSKPSPDSSIPPPPYNYETIEWMETFNGGTNWYDQAFSETVLESLDFEYDTQHKGWFCILGGAQQLSKILESKITQKPHYGNRVTKITAKGPMEVEIQVDTPHGKKTKCQYKGLVNTTTLGCMRQMDVSRAGLNYATKQALRSLGYGPSSKVAIKFKRAWWIHDLGTHGVKMGGLGHSDLSIRTCVYPSYNIYDDADGTAVLLCSYTWQQDAERIAALVSSNPEPDQKVAEEAELKELLLRDLARLHRSEHMSEEELYELVRDNYITHHAHAWGGDPNTAGAFAFFRPQQFTKMWNKMIQPSGDVVIAGEAASPHHAWVVGALESVIHGLHAWMAENVSLVPALSLAMAILERNEPGNPFVGLPPYMTPDISKWQGDLGRRHRSRYLDPIRKPGGV